MKIPRKLRPDEFKLGPSKYFEEHHNIPRISSWTKFFGISFARFHEERIKDNCYSLYCKWYDKNMTKLGQVLS